MPMSLNRCHPSCAHIPQRGEACVEPSSLLLIVWCWHGRYPPHARTYPDKHPLGWPPPAYKVVTIDTHCIWMCVLWGQHWGRWSMGQKGAVIVVHGVRMVLTWPSHLRTYHQWRPIEPATTCIWGSNHRLALHMNACPVGSTLGQVEWGVETEETWIQNINMPCLFVWLPFVYPNRVCWSALINKHQKNIPHPLHLGEKAWNSKKYISCNWLEF